MKYQNMRAFQKHLESAAPEHLCHCYLIAIFNDHERGKMFAEIRSRLVGHMPWALSGSSATFSDVSDALLSRSLFGGESVLFLDETEKMGKKDLQALSDFVSGQCFAGYLICGARSKTQLTPAFEKWGVVLDATDEKPWDKEKRIEEQLFTQAGKAGKRLAPDAAALLFERLGWDSALLECELDKLICYVGDRPVIERPDIFRIAGTSRVHTIWQTAEEVVWERTLSSIESDDFRELVPALRFQLELGMKLTDLVASRTAREEWGAYLPRIWPKTLDKRVSQVTQLGSVYFQRGLSRLFEIELLSRTGSVREAALLDLFRCSLGR